MLPPSLPHCSRCPGGRQGTLTELVVVGDGDGSTGTGTLLGEVVAKAHDGGALLQHGGHLHLHCVTQPLALWGQSEARHTETLGTPLSPP